MVKSSLDKTKQLLKTLQTKFPNLSKADLFSLVNYMPTKVNEVYLVLKQNQSASRDEEEMSDIVQVVKRFKS